MILAHGRIQTKGYVLFYIFCYFIYNIVIFADYPSYFIINLLLVLFFSIVISFLFPKLPVVDSAKVSVKHARISISLAYLLLAINVSISYDFSLDVFLVSHSELHKTGGNYGWNFVILNFVALLVSCYIANARKRTLVILNVAVIALAVTIVYSRNPALVFLIMLGFCIAPGALINPFRPRYVFLCFLAIFFLVIINNRRAVGTVDFLSGKGFEGRNMFNYFLNSPEFSVASRISNCLAEFSFSFNDVVLYFSSIFLNFLGLANYESLYSVKFSRLCDTTGGFNDLFFLTYLTLGGATLLYFVFFSLLIGSLFFIMVRLRRKYYTIYLSAVIIWLILNSFRIDLAILSRMYLSALVPIFLFFIFSHITIRLRLSTK